MSRFFRWVVQQGNDPIWRLHIFQMGGSTTKHFMMDPEIDGFQKRNLFWYFGKIFHVVRFHFDERLTVQYTPPKTEQLWLEDYFSFEMILLQKTCAFSGQSWFSGTWAVYSWYGKHLEVMFLKEGGVHQAPELSIQRREDTFHHKSLFSMFYL